jgi:hypothetical protein
MQDLKSDKEQLISGSEMAIRRPDFDVYETLGMRHLRLMTVDAEAKPEDPNPAPSAPKTSSGP